MKNIINDIAEIICGYDGDSPLNILEAEAIVAYLKDNDLLKES